MWATGPAPTTHSCRAEDALPVTVTAIGSPTFPPSHWRVERESVVSTATFSSFFRPGINFGMMIATSSSRHSSNFLTKLSPENIVSTQENAPNIPAPPAVCTSQPSHHTVLLMQVLCVTAMGISTYLSWVAATSSKVFGCGGDLFDCSHVLNSRWSTVLGIPIGIPALALYLVSLSALVVVRKSPSVARRQQAWAIVTVCLFAAGLAAVWFISLQVFSIGHICPWCLTAHICGIILSGLVLWTRPVGPKHTLRLAAISAVGVAGLIGGQFMSTP